MHLVCSGPECNDLEFAEHTLASIRIRKNRLATTSINYIIAITFANLHTKYHAYIIAWWYDDIYNILTSYSPQPHRSWETRDIYDGSKLIKMYYFHFLAAVHFMSKLIYYVLDFLHIQIWAAQRWGSEVTICLLLSAAVQDFTKYIMTSIPFPLPSCLPVTSHIAECPVAAIPPEPSWFPTTVLHLPWLQCKAIVKLEIPIRAYFPTKMRRKIYIPFVASSPVAASQHWPYHTPRSLHVADLVWVLNPLVEVSPKQLVDSFVFQKNKW
jgi:hypothetical protein